VYVDEIWRYPVKSLRGERLDETELLDGGIPGDRVVHVRAPGGGRIVTSRIRPRLLALAGTLGPDGEPLIDGIRWDSPEARAAVRDAAGADAEPAFYDGPERFDILPLLVATDGAIAAFGRDGRRLRPNIVIGGVEGLAERTWEGRSLTIGDVVIRLEDLRARCVMTTFDPDTQEQDANVLRDINARFGGELALNAYAESAGTIAVGDPVELPAEL
jgi:uncharacterized protein YcbX